MIYTPPFWAMAVANFSQTASFSAFFLLPLYLLDHGGDGGDVGVVMGIFALASAVCRPWISEMIDRIAETFPRLRERLKQSADTLSGGEQQMLAIARAMVAEPRMIMLDEPSEGIMPILVAEMFELFERLKQQGVTILIVEQNVERALTLADRAYVMDQGAIVHSGNAKELLADSEIQERYCAI